MRTGAWLPTLLLGWSLLSPPQAAAVIDCELNGEAISTSNGNTTRGKTGLIRCHHRDSGEPQRDVQIKDGRFEGVVRFYRDGKVVDEHSVNARGNRHGLAREYDEHGVLIREATYEDGDTVGIMRRFDGDSHLVGVSYYEQGRSIASADLLADGRPHDLRCADRPVLAPHVPDDEWCGFGNGRTTLSLYNHRGQVIEVRDVDHGQIVAREERDGESGKPIYRMARSGDSRTDTRFKEGVRAREEVTVYEGQRRFPVSLKEFDDRGELSRSVLYCGRGRRGEPLRERSYYMNGQLRSDQVFYYDDPARVVERAYSDAGKRLAEGTHRIDGRGRTPVGVHRSYDDDGRLRAERHFDDQGQLQRVRELDADGTVVRDDAVFPDGSRRAFRAP